LKRPECLILKLKPLVIVVADERIRLYKDLKKHLEMLEKLVNDPETPIGVKMRALNLIAKIIQIAAAVVEDFELDEIQRDIEILKQELREAEEAGNP